MLSSMFCQEELPVEAEVNIFHVGKTLCAARRKQELLCENVAAVLRIRVSYIEAIEAGNWDDLPGETYARGYVRRYAELLKIADPLQYSPDRSVNEHIDNQNQNLKNNKIKTAENIPVSTLRYGERRSRSRLTMAERTGVSPLMKLIAVLLVVVLGLLLWGSLRVQEADTQSHAVSSVRAVPERLTGYELSDAMSVIRREQAEEDVSAVSLCQDSVFDGAYPCFYGVWEHVGAKQFGVMQSSVLDAVAYHMAFASEPAVLGNVIARTKPVRVTKPIFAKKRAVRVAPVKRRAVVKSKVKAPKAVREKKAVPDYERAYSPDAAAAKSVAEKLKKDWKPGWLAKVSDGASSLKDRVKEKIARKKQDKLKVEDDDAQGMLQPSSGFIGRPDFESEE